MEAVFMNTTISLHQELLARGRHLFDLGCLSESSEALRPLMKQAGVATHTLCEAHRLLGEIELEFGNYRISRRHFALAIGLVGDESSLYSLYAQAVEADPDGDPVRAFKARRRAARLDPTNAAVWSALGWSCLRAGNRPVAFKAFRRAMRLRPASLDTLAETIEGLLTLNRLREAEKAVRAARFRLKKSSGLKNLDDRVQFEILRREQDRRLDIDAGAASVLKFVPQPSVTPFQDVNPVVIRTDRRSLPKPHLLKFFGMRTGPTRMN